MCASEQSFHRFFRCDTACMCATVDDNVSIVYDVVEWLFRAGHHEEVGVVFWTSNLTCFASILCRVCEAESREAGDALVMGACTRCLTYVMLHKSDPKCPRCESEVPLDFMSPPSKRQRVETTIQT